MKPIKEYYSEHNVEIDNSDSTCGCFNVVKVLPELVGTKVSTLTIALLQSLGARSVRIHHGCVTCDAVSGRASIWVDENDIIKNIEIEVSINVPNEWGSMCGSDIDYAIKKNLGPPDRKNRIVGR